MRESTGAGRQRGRALRRADRWLRRSWGPWPVSAEAFALLQERLTVRRRFGWALLAVSVPVLAAVVWSFAAALGQADPAGLQEGQRRTGVVVAIALLILSGVGVALKEVSYRADARIGSRLAHRVARPARVPIRVMLGRAPSALLVVGVPVQFALGVLALAVGGGAFAQLYLLAVLVVGAVAVVGVRRAAARATVAVDAASLAIDERLRTADAFGCLGWIPQLSIAPAQALLTGVPIGWVFLVYLGGMAVVYGLWMGAVASQPRQSAPLPLIAGPVGGWPVVPGAGS